MLITVLAPASIRLSSMLERIADTTLCADGRYQNQKE